MLKKTYERAQAELINVETESTLFTDSSTDIDPYDDRPGWYYDDTYIQCGEVSYCDAYGEEVGWVEC